MLAEMTGQEIQDWQAYFIVKNERQRAEALDRKGKHELQRMMRG